jgi:hypothetical protein
MVPKSKKSNSIRETLLSWSDTCDINCFKKIFEYKKNYFAQFLWLLILLASTGATLFVIAKSVIDYFNYNVVSLTEIVQERPAKFPTVTFCDFNAFSTKEAEKLFVNISNQYHKSLDSFNVTSLATIEASMPAYGNDKRKKLGFNFDQITSCFINFKDCKHDLHWYYSYDYGNCFQFNSGFNLVNKKISRINMTRDGLEFGPSISIFPLINTNEYSAFFGNALAVFVHEHKFKPDQVIYVRPGESTVIAVRRKRIKKYPQPYSDCIDLASFKSDLYDYIIKSNQTYRQKDCFELCIQKMVIKECKCYDLNYESLSTNLRPCLTLDDLNCLEDQWEKLNVKECIKKSCPLECDSLEYELSLSSLEYPSRNFYASLVNSQSYADKFKFYFNSTTPISYEQFKSHAVNFQVYYPSLEYTQITELPKMDTYDLLTQIGGALGLFVSFSVFTLFETIELFIMILHALIIK